LFIFEPILTTFKPIIVFRGSWGSIKNWLEPKIEPPSGNLACPNRWNALYHVSEFGEKNERKLLRAAACKWLNSEQVSISLKFYASVFRTNFGAKNYETGFWVWNFGAKNFVQKMRVLNVDEIDNSLTRTENFWNRKRITNAGATKEGQNRSWKSEEFFRNPETNTSRRSSCPVIFHSFFKSFETYT